MPQVKRSLALIYAVIPFGADHMSSEHDPDYEEYPEYMAEIGLTDPQPSEVLNEEKVRFTLITQYLKSCLDSINLCQFVYGAAWQLYSPAQIVEVVQAITGWNVTIEELMQVGERRLNMMRAFNAREGFNREKDTFPRKLEVSLVGGESDGINIPLDDLEKTKGIYYKMAGWDIETGGGSGHIPVFLGYVGKGLAGAVAVGNVFSSPSTQQMLEMTRAANSGEGVLHLFGNYTGDVMNFEMAA